jgi:hypothetical protein
VHKTDQNKFYLTGLGKDRFLQGHPFLWTFNATIKKAIGRRGGDRNFRLPIYSTNLTTSMRGLESCGAPNKNKGEALAALHITTSEKGNNRFGNSRASILNTVN